MDLKDAFPEVHSFSITNLKYMKYFFELYPDAINRPQPGDGSDPTSNRPQPGDNSGLPENRQKLVQTLDKELIFYIPWGHQKLLIDKCKREAECGNR